MKNNIPSKSITFFMLVTNRDCMFGNYAVDSFKKIYNKLSDMERQNFKLFVYLNALTADNLEKYAKKWAALPYVEIFDNTEKIKAKNLAAGETITSPEGIDRVRDDANENYDELWTSELPKFNTDYIATVDADFEILNPDFYFYLRQQLDESDILVASTCYSPSAFCYESYSERNMHIHERNHTWFCIYKKEAFEISKRSHFYFERLNNDGTTYGYDSAAYFQEELRNKTGQSFISVPYNYRNSFLHYGAGSKNKSITIKNVYFYRLIFIFTRIGIFYTSKNNPVISFVNKVVRKVCRILFKKIHNKLQVERSRFYFD